MYDPIEITKLLVFGTNNPSSPDYNEHIRPYGATPASIPPYSMIDYMTNGGGRYAYPSLFGAVEKFFNTINIEPGTYIYTTQGGQIQNGSGLGLVNEDFVVGISQYGTDIYSADHAERSYIFGSTNFAITSIEFEVSGIGDIGVNRTIKKMEVKAFNDNFDFNSDNLLVQAFNNSVLKPMFDPYELGRGTVTLEFTGQGKIYENYRYFENFLGDQFVNELQVSKMGTADGAAKDAAGLALLAGTDGIPYLSN